MKMHNKALQTNAQPLLLLNYRGRLQDKQENVQHLEQQGNIR